MAKNPQHASQARKQTKGTVVGKPKYVAPAPRVAPIPPNATAWGHPMFLPPRPTVAPIPPNATAWGHPMFLPQPGAQPAPGVQPPAPAPPAPEAPAPGPTKPADPFLYPDQQIAYTTAQGQHIGNLYNLDYALDDLKRNTTYNLTQIDKKAKVDASASMDSMIARGLYQSSIKDGELYDIAATAALRKQFLTDALNAAQLKHDTDVKTENDTWAGIQGGYDKLGVKNAQDLPVVPPDGSSQPTPGQPAPGQPQPVRPIGISQVQQPITVSRPAVRPIPRNATAWGRPMFIRPRRSR